MIKQTPEMQPVVSGLNTNISILHHQIGEGVIYAFGMKYTTIAMPNRRDIRITIDDVAFNTQVDGANSPYHRYLGSLIDGLSTLGSSHIMIEYGDIFQGLVTPISPVLIYLPFSRSLKIETINAGDEFYYEIVYGLKKCC